VATRTELGMSALRGTGVMEGSVVVGVPRSEDTGCPTRRRWTTPRCILPSTGMGGVEKNGFSFIDGHFNTTSMRGPS
jgi:hypothetical protein